ncbi:methyltransferase domain-containing protein [Microbulbifer sp. OS29]|uniref:Methyltransferase domain-containing protein n=1 Tax=Microbulbifer okhotskensis TaxID=2926617 RepID=A0A9X2J5F4_9GAMM|nr:methyltransferase domain-containing protein [Microbulbifer okhotskensis]MCO1334334.1 methyltransferase domain-containing protein [Microbulbifer okhotskensis]
MRNKRKFIPLNLEDDLLGHPTTFLTLSEEAQAFVSKIIDDSFSIRFSIDFEPNSNHRASLHGPPDLIDLFTSLNLQVRCDIIADGYNVATPERAAIYCGQPQEFEKFALALGLGNDCKVLDLMCGSGTVSCYLFQFAQERGITIQCSLCDSHCEQLGLIDQNTRLKATDITIADGRGLPYPNELFDAVAIKMGLHEVPQADQPLVLQEALRILKPGGPLVIWDLVPGSGEVQDLLCAQKKKISALTHRESLIFDRFFLREDQLLRLLEDVGFKDTERVSRTYSRDSTMDKLKTEFGGDKCKLEILNSYLRERVTHAIIDEVCWEDSGQNISIMIPNCIYRTYKPVNLEDNIPLTDTSSR